MAAERLARKRFDRRLKKLHGRADRYWRCGSGGRAYRWPTLLSYLVYIIGGDVVEKFDRSIGIFTWFPRPWTDDGVIYGDQHRKNYDIFNTLRQQLIYRDVSVAAPVADQSSKGVA